MKNWRWQLLLGAAFNSPLSMGHPPHRRHSALDYDSPISYEIKRTESCSMVASGEVSVKAGKLQEGRNDLTRTRYWWLKNPAKMDEDLWRDFRSLREGSLKTARAWAIKELAMTLWEYVSRGWATRSRLEPVKKVARMLKEHLWGILNAIVLKVNNAKSEGINFKIQKLKSRACGYRNRDRFRRMIYFHLGGLDLYPAGVKE